jgi:hypothetical protein
MNRFVYVCIGAILGAIIGVAMAAGFGWPNPPLVIAFWAAMGVWSGASADL